MSNLTTLIRQRRGWTQSDLAKALGCTRQAVSHYETGRRRPDMDTAYKLVDLAAECGVAASLEDVYPRSAKSAAA